MLMGKIGRNHWLYDTKLLLVFGKGMLYCAIKGDGGRDRSHKIC